jgi:adenylate kinase family enzyme
MRRVAVIGGSCSGKTTLARALAARLGVPHVELDALHHDPGWQEAPAEVLRERVLAEIAAAPEGWVMDGNYFGKLGDLVLERADTVVLLDLPHRTVLGRVLWRTLTRVVMRTELWNGNRERLRDAFGRNSIVWWVVRTHRGFATKWQPRLAQHPHLDVVRLHSVSDIGMWLQSIQARPVTSGSSGSSERQKTPPFVER